MRAAGLNGRPDRRRNASARDGCGACAGGPPSSLVRNVHLLLGAAAASGCLEVKPRAASDAGPVPSGLVGLTATHNSNVPIEHGAPPQTVFGQLVVRSEHTVASFSATDGQGMRQLQSLQLTEAGANPLELLFASAPGDCTLQDGLGMAFYPGWSTSANPETPVGSYMNFEAIGPALFQVRTGWNFSAPCASGNSELTGSTLFTFFPDGRIHRFDDLSVGQACVPRIDEPIRTACGFGANPQPAYLTSFAAFDADRFTDVAWSAGGSPGTASVQADLFELLYANGAWACASDDNSQARVAAIYADEATNVADGEGGRLATFIDSLFGERPALGFTWDFDVHTVPNGEIAAQRYLAATQLVVDRSTAGCADVSTRALALHAPARLYEENQQLEHAYYREDRGTYTWTRPELDASDRVVVATRGDDPIVSGFVLQVGFSTQTTAVQVWRDDLVGGPASRLVRLVEGVDYLINAYDLDVRDPDPGTPEDDLHVFSIWVPQRLAGNQALLVQDAALPMTDTDL